MELEAYEDGTLLHIGVKDKEVAPINAVIAVIGEPGENIATLLEESKQSPEQQEASPGSNTFSSTDSR